MLLTSESRASSSRYEIVIGSMQNSVIKLRRIKSNASADVITTNLTSPVKENEMRSFWIEVEKERVLFGSGEKVMKSHDPKLHNLKYCRLKFTPLPRCQSRPCNQFGLVKWRLACATLKQKVFQQFICALYGPQGQIVIIIQILLTILLHDRT